MILQVESIPVSIVMPAIPARFAEWWHTTRSFRDEFAAGISRAIWTRLSKAAIPIDPPAILTDYGRDAWTAGNVAGYEAFMEAKDKPAAPPAVSVGA